MIGRARIVFFAGLIAAIVIVATEFPLGQLMRARAALAQGSSQLRALDTENRQLPDRSLAAPRDSTVARIAHQDYGLVKRGSDPSCVLPSPAESGHRRRTAQHDESAGIGPVVPPTPS